MRIKQLANFPFVGAIHELPLRKVEVMVDLHLIQCYLLLMLSNTKSISHENARERYFLSI
jgi:hypothetical protein